MDENQHLTASQAWETYLSKGVAVLIDVRTDKEWNDVGVPDLNDKQLKLICSHLPPDMAVNPVFALSLECLVPDKNTKVFFICKTNGRSSMACSIATKLGYNDCNLIVDGFEGSSLGEGWKKSNLPIKKLKNIC